MSKMNVPFTDLRRTHDPMHAELLSAFENTLSNSAFVGGASVSTFEASFADYCGAAYCAGVSSGTSALSLVFEALGIGRGDEVIVPANTFFATAEAVSNVGATPIFCDVDEKTCTISRANAEAVISSRTKAIVGVHLYGQLCDVEGLAELCRVKKLHFVEDCAQAHGAQLGKRRAGTFGVAGCFSFYPGKNLGALGEAGAVITLDSKLDEKIRILREHGQKLKHEHLVAGYNHRLHSLQAAFLSVKLKYLEGHNRDRQKIASQYLSSLRSAKGLTLPSNENPSAHVFHLFSVFHENPKFLAAELGHRGIATGFHYPVPCHFQPAYEDRSGASVKLPVAEKLCRTQLSLPIFPGMTEHEVKYVCAVVNEICEKGNDELSQNSAR